MSAAVRAGRLAGVIAGVVIMAPGCGRGIALEPGIEHATPDARVDDGDAAAPGRDAAAGLDDAAAPDGTHDDAADDDAQDGDDDAAPMPDRAPTAAWDAAEDDDTPPPPFAFISLAFTPEGALAMGANDGSVRLLQPNQQTISPPLLMAATAVTALAFARDGSLIATGGDGHIVLWAQPARTELRTIDARVDSIGTLAFSPDGALVLAGANGATGDVSLFHTDSGALAATLTDANRAAFSADGKLVLAVGGGFARLWTIDGQLVRGFGSALAIRGAALSPDGTRIAISGSDTLEMRRVDGGAQLWAEYVTLGEAGGTIFFMANGTKAAVRGDMAIAVHDSLTGKPTHQIALLGSTPIVACDGRLVGIAFGDEVQLWRLSDGMRVVAATLWPRGKA